MSGIIVSVLAFIAPDPGFDPPYVVQGIQQTLKAIWVLMFTSNKGKYSLLYLVFLIRFILLSISKIFK